MKPLSKDIQKFHRLVKEEKYDTIFLKKAIVALVFSFVFQFVNIFLIDKFEAYDFIRIGLIVLFSFMGVVLWIISSFMSYLNLSLSHSIVSQIIFYFNLVAIVPLSVIIGVMFL